MKKIIATVLAMVMALALCTVAFADTTTTYEKVYTNDGKEIALQEETAVTIVSILAKKDVSVKGYTITFTAADSDKSLNDVSCVAGTAADYDLKVTKDGKAPLYLTKAPNATLKYNSTGKVYTNIGDKCEQLDVTDTSLTYYVVTDEDTDTNTYYVAEAGAGTNLLVDGKLVAVRQLMVGNVAQGLTKHTWKVASYDKDDKVATYKCKECGTVATVYKTVEAAEAAGATMTDTKDGYVIGWVNGKTETKTDSTTSPKTFDAGIAMYVGMALTSVAGSAVVIGKKKEF